MKKVLLFGTFDGIHQGHINLFNQAKRYGDYLVIVVARDITVKKIKKRYSLRNELERLRDLKNNTLVDEAMLGYKDNPYKIIKKINPNIICLGYDQDSFIKDLPVELNKLKIKAKIYRLKAYKPKKYHSSIIRPKH